MARFTLRAPVKEAVVPRTHTKQDDREFEDAQGAHDRYAEAKRTGASTPGRERAARITKGLEARTAEEWKREAAQHALNQDAVQRLNARSRQARENKTGGWKRTDESTAEVALRIIAEETKPKHHPVSVNHRGSPVVGVTTTPRQSLYSDHEAHDVHHDGQHVGHVHSYSSSAVRKKNSVRMRDSGKTRKKWGYDLATPTGNRYADRGSHYSSKKDAVEELLRAHLDRNRGPNESYELKEEHTPISPMSHDELTKHYPVDLVHKGRKWMMTQGHRTNSGEHSAEYRNVDRHETRTDERVWRTKSGKVHDE